MIIKVRTNTEALPGQMDIEDVTESPGNLVTGQNEVVDLFTYAALTREDEVAAREDAALIKSNMRKATEAVIEVGLALKRQKERLPHGMFLPWISSEFEMAERSARKYMSIAEQFSGKTAVTAGLGIEALALLAAPSTPQEVRDHVEALLVDGEKVTAADIKRLKAEKKPEFILPKPSKSSEIESLNAKIRELTAKNDEEAQRRVVAEDKLKRAAADLRKAEAEAREAEKLPKAKPLTEEQKAEQRRVFGTQDDRAIGARIDEIIDRIKEQPGVDEAVSRIPPAEIHTIDTTAIRSAAKWLSDFAEAWERL